jgi:hypothetical protein
VGDRESVPTNALAVLNQLEEGRDGEPVNGIPPRPDHQLDRPAPASGCGKTVTAVYDRKRVTGIRPIFVAALVAAMLPPCTQSCDALSSGQQFPIATGLFAHPMPIYWRDRLFSKVHYPSSHAGAPIATLQQTS